ncbi:MAG: C39 family peptidase [Chloroflexota bacterium]
MANRQPVRLVILRLLLIGAVLTSAFVPSAPMGSYWKRKLEREGKMNLPVTAILQSKYTSCGEAVITMAYNYAYPETQITEQEVIDYATEEGLFTENKWPFTSPENMVLIAELYADAVSTGSVTDADEALALLTEKLTGGDPVMIDILVRLNRPDSGAHFVVVTGLDITNPKAVKIYYNDPLMGKNRWSYWHGGEGIWHAWQNNDDPGGAGWWMVIASP